LVQAADNDIKLSGSVSFAPRPPPFSLEQHCTT